MGRYTWAGSTKDLSRSLFSEARTTILAVTGYHEANASETAAIAREMSWQSTRGQPLLKGTCMYHNFFLLSFSPPLTFAVSKVSTASSSYPSQDRIYSILVLCPAQQGARLAPKRQATQAGSVWAGLNLCRSRGSFTVGGFAWW